MFCTECGLRGHGKFCGGCGTRLGEDLSEDSPQAHRAHDWQHEIDYAALVAHPEVRDRISRAAAEAGDGFTGEQFLDFCGKALAPLTVVPLPLSAIARFSQNSYAKLGVKTGKKRCETFAVPPGRVLAALLCSMARHGRKVIEARQLADGCLIEAELPSDMLALAGRIVAAVRHTPSGTVVELSTNIPGQMFDWGKSSRALEQMLTETAAAA